MSVNYLNQTVAIHFLYGLWYRYFIRSAEMSIEMEINKVFSVVQNPFSHHMSVCVQAEWRVLFQRILQSVTFALF